MIKFLDVRWRRINHRWRMRKMEAVYRTFSNIPIYEHRLSWKLNNHIHRHHRRARAVRKANHSNSSRVRRIGGHRGQSSILILAEMYSTLARTASPTHLGRNSPGSFIADVIESPEHEKVSICKCMIIPPSCFHFLE